MSFLLIFDWCWAAVGDLLGHNSRLGVFNSRLGRRKFPFQEATGIGRQELDLLYRFRSPNGGFQAKSKKFPVQREKSGIAPRPEEPAVAPSTNNGADLRTRAGGATGTASLPSNPTHDWTI
jgi:hypothetical protein